MLQVYVIGGHSLSGGPKNELLNGNSNCYVRITAIGINGNHTLIGYTNLSTRKGPNPEFDVSRANIFKVPFVAASLIRFDIIQSKSKIHDINSESSNIFSSATFIVNDSRSPEIQKLDLHPPAIDSLTFQTRNISFGKKYVQTTTGLNQNAQLGQLDVIVLPELLPIDDYRGHFTKLEHIRTNRIFIYLSTPPGINGNSSLNSNPNGQAHNSAELQIFRFHHRGEYASIIKSDSMHSNWSEFFNGTKIFDFDATNIKPFYYSAIIESNGDYTSNPIEFTVNYCAYVNLDSQNPEEQHFVLFKEQTVKVDRNDTYSLGILFWSTGTEFKIIDRTQIKVGPVQPVHETGQQSQATVVSPLLSSDTLYRTLGNNTIDAFAQRVAPKFRRNYERPEFNMSARRTIYPSSSTFQVFNLVNTVDYWSSLFPARIIVSVCPFAPSKIRTVELQYWLFDEFYHPIDLTGELFDSTESNSQRLLSGCVYNDINIAGSNSSIDISANNINEVISKRTSSSLSLRLPEIPLDIHYIFLNCTTTSDINLDAELKITDQHDGFTVASSEVTVYHGKTWRNLMLFYRKTNDEWEFVEVPDSLSAHKPEKMKQLIASKIKECLHDVKQRELNVGFVQSRRKSLF